jgi:hypothetical protein
MNSVQARMSASAHRVVAVLVGLLVLLIFSSQAAPNLYAQAVAFNAQLSGSIYDHTGATVPGATITLSNPGKGFTRTFTSSQDGRYGFTLLAPGTYALRVEKLAFRPYSQSGIVLAVGQSAVQDVTLELGAVTQEVTVTAAAPILNTSNANVASDVTQKQAVELPLNWRSVFALVRLDSSVNDSQQYQGLNPPGSQSNADQDISFFNFGGGRFGTTAFLLDGHWDSAGDWDGIIYVPGVDELQEFKIQTHAFTAQYGWSMGNVVNAITKSGTNSFHGNVFEFLRNDNFDANYFFNNRAVPAVPKPEFKRNQFGFTAGGPLYIPKLYEQRDKTFIFGGYEALRQGTPITRVTTVPTGDMRRGNFSALLGAQIGTDALGRPILSGQLYNPFTTREIIAGQLDPVTGLMATQDGYIRDPIAGNDLAGMLDPVAEKIAPYWPDPTGSGLVNNFTAGVTAPVSSDAYSVRVDHNISDKARMFARWSQKREYKQVEAPVFGTTNPGGPGSKNPNNRWDFALNYNRAFTPTFVMSVNFGWNRWAEGWRRQSSPFDPSTLGLPSFLNTNPGAFPSITMDDIAQLGYGAYNSTPREAGTYAIDFTKVRGAHTMNIGFMGVNHRLYTSNQPLASFHFPKRMTQGPDPTAANPNTGFGFASFMLGTGDSGNFNVQANGAYHKGFYGWYFQDDWKATRKLTLNLGVRYDFQTAPRDRFDRYSWFDYTDPNPISEAVGFTVPGHLVYVGDGNRRGIYEPEYTNIAPRVGLAYRVTDRLVARAGFGMFYIPAMEYGDYQGLNLNGFTQATPYVGTVDGITPTNLLSDPFPGGMLLPPGKSAGALTFVGLGVNAVENFRPTPYIEQWSLALQYELSANNSFGVTYVGNHGVKLITGASGVEQNQLYQEQLSLGNSLLDPVSNPFFGHIASSGCGLDQATVPRGQLLRSFPEYCSVYDPQPPAGFSSYNAVQLKFEHRWSMGLLFLGGFTIAKYLDNSSGPEGWTSWAGQQIRDNHNLSAEKSLNSNDIPKSLVLSYIYELPFGRGKRYGGKFSGPVDAVLGGWQVSGVSTFKDGFPLAIWASSNNTQSLGGFQRPNLVGDPHVANPTIDRWFNTDAFAQPPAFTFGNVPRTMPTLRAPGINNWDLAIQKWWNWKEKLRVQFRAEMFNAFNHPIFYAPNTTFGDAAFSRVSAAYPARSVQFGLKIHW